MEYLMFRDKNEYFTLRDGEKVLRFRYIRPKRDGETVRPPAVRIIIGSVFFDIPYPHFVTFATAYNDLLDRMREELEEVSLPDTSKAENGYVV